MPVVHLVRHGQATQDGETYDRLSGLGREQAAVVGAELAGRGLRDPLVVSGTLERQRDTAAAVVGALGLRAPHPADPRWNEYDHLGLLERYPPPSGAPASGGSSNRGLQALLDHALSAWIEDSAPGEPCWRTFTEGAHAALRELIADLGPGRDAVVVTSGGVLAALCGGLLSASPSGVVAMNRVTVNAAITTVTAGRSGVSLLAFNDHAHFTAGRRGMLTHR